MSYDEGRIQNGGKKTGRISVLRSSVRSHAMHAIRELKKERSFSVSESLEGPGSVFCNEKLSFLSYKT